MSAAPCDAVLNDPDDHTTIEPVGKQIVVWSKLLQAKAIETYKVLEPELQKGFKSFQEWLAQTMQCLCLPIQQQLNFKPKAASDGEYPPPVVTAAPA